MNHYKQLAREQRYQISGLKKAGLSQSQIADEVGVHKSTISREFRRNKGRRGWHPKQAQELQDERRKNYANAQRHSLLEWAEVERLIRQDMSPEQASQRLALEGGLPISHESIYLHIYTDKRRGGDLWRHLRCQKPRRKRYASGQERRGTIKNRIGIDERPVIVEQKSRIGDWEGDTVIGKNHPGALVTLAERKSRYILAAQVPNKHASGVTAAVTRLLRPHKGKCYTMTFDNGKEFAEHQTIAAELNADVYFAHPYHSWERGLNENSNGLLRQYFPKGMELVEAIQEQVQWAVDRLNHRSRKVLGFRTPFEVFFGKTVRYIKSPLSVALRN
ncbi:IS30 family transposase [Nitrosomonas cryotolerans]|uniref:Transposase, IS30 family n=2 Tax=Nitrosomonas cryotolerans TaxID=44575 RepID=A0A1N6J9H0_9PROT|nr:IS30 family transposase [Nitrosomonas cryotolerans]SIO40922.1 transposase, IS30 family [Nitrosomonas cryotolerans ATCC 49181]